MLTAAVRLKIPVGVNVTLIVHVPPLAPTELPQVFVCAKSPAFVPVKVMLLIVRLAFPVLVNVTDWEVLVELTFWLPKFKLEVERLTTPESPVPDKETDCGLPGPLSAILIAAERLPMAVGVKVTLIVQLAPAPTELPQVLVWEKSPLLVPVTLTLVMLRLALPLLVRTMFWAVLGVLTAWLPKVRPEVERLAVGPEPVPARLTLWIAPARLLLLSVTVSVAERAPGAVGVNVTLTAQFPPAATELPQVLVCAKSPGFVPVKAMLVMLRLAFPVLFRVTVWGALVEFTFWLPKVRVPGDTPASGALPVPLRVNDCGLVLALSVMATEAAREPGAVGEKVTPMLQVPPEDTGLPQVFVCAKSPPFVPDTTTLVTFKVELPVLVTVTLCTLLADPTF